MFEGEMASLTAILKTDTVKVPKPIKVLDGPGGGSMLVMEHLDMRSLNWYVRTPSPVGFASVELLHACSLYLGVSFCGCDRKSLSTTQCAPHVPCKP